MKYEVKPITYNDKKGYGLFRQFDLEHIYNPEFLVFVYPQNNNVKSELQAVATDLEYFIKFCQEKDDAIPFSDIEEWLINDLYG